MKRLMGILAALLMLCTALPAAGAAEPTEQTDVKALIEGNNAFALNMYGKLKDQKGNLFFSPFSISTALGMTYAGARGETAAQMENALRFPFGQEHLHPAFHTLIWDIQGRQKTGNYQLSVANALWGQKGEGFLPDFLKLTKDTYGAGLREVDFKADAEAARKTINLWVEEQTNQKIKDLIQQGMLNQMTRLVLTNAIYFKAPWAHVFQKRNTKDGPFTLADGTKLQAPMMRQTEHFSYAETEDLQALELPYRGQDLSMLIMLPRKADGISALDTGIAAKGLEGCVTGLRGCRVDVTVPKFKTTSQFRLDDALGALGMTDAFGGKADFSGMNGKKDLSIGAVIHKAYVDVNEEGTEAAAATAVVMMGAAAPRPEETKEFRADHPFLFLIRDRRTGSILFMGRVMNPKE